jgi:hypothetical protein
VKLEVPWLRLIGRYVGFFVVARTQLLVSESNGVLVRNASCVHIAQNRIIVDNGRNS